MKCRPQPRDAFELFQSHFDQMLDSRHELVIPANKIGWSGLEAAFVDTYCLDILDRADRIRTQQPKDKKKLYSLHEPEVQCISKAKPTSDTKKLHDAVSGSGTRVPKTTSPRSRHQNRRSFVLMQFIGYEFGQKVAIATTNRSNWIVAAPLMPNNPYDGHTLAATLSATEQVTGVAVADAYVDKGYRGHGYTGEAEVPIAGQRRKNTTRAERKRRRRRSAIEPKIGHLKSDHRMGRCFLARLAGDAINAVLAAAGSNLRKLLGLIRRKAGRFVFALIQAYRNPMTALPDRRPFQLAAA